MPQPDANITDSIPAIQTLQLDASAARFAEIVPAGGGSSAADVFGETSRRILSEAPQAEMWAMVDGWLFQGLTVVLALFYIILVLHYAELIGYYISLCLGGGTTARRRPAQHSASGERSNCEVALAVSGGLLIALVAVRFGGVLTASALPSLEGTWQIFGVVLGFVLTLAALHECALYIFGRLSGYADTFGELRAVKLRHFATSVATLFPFVVIALLAAPESVPVWLWSMAAVCSVWVILFIKETFLLFRSQKVSILHWILYLCAVEIFPISLLLAPLLRAE